MPRYERKGYKRKIDLRQATLLYKAGYSIRQIGTHFGVTKQTAHAALVKAGVHTPTPYTEPPPLSDAEIEEARRRYEEYIERLTVRRYKEARIQDEARRQIALAIARGDLTPSPCEVCNEPVLRASGRQRVHAHHDDYSKPLAVRWLCPKHHKHWHKTNRPTY